MFLVNQWCRFEVYFWNLVTFFMMNLQLHGGPGYTKEDGQMLIGFILFK